MILRKRWNAQTIADDLRTKIHSGQVAPGDQLDTVRGMARHYSVSTATVTKALARLDHVEGLIERPRGGAGGGGGIFVRRYDRLEWWPDLFEHLQFRADTPEAGADAWAADVIRQGKQPRQEVRVDTVDPPVPSATPPGVVAPPSVADALHTPPGERVVVRWRDRWVNGEPYQTADSYYPLDVAHGTPIMDPGDVTIPGGLMAAAGHRQVNFDDWLICRPPSEDEVRRLALPPGTWVMVHTRVGYNGDDRPVRVIITVLRSDRHIIRSRTAA